MVAPFAFGAACGPADLSGTWTGACSVDLEDEADYEYRVEIQLEGGGRDDFSGSAEVAAEETTAVIETDVEGSQTGDLVFIDLVLAEEGLTQHWTFDGEYTKGKGELPDTIDGVCERIREQGGSRDEVEGTFGLERE
jgi:hypothetical protein